jgi:hypothetical protein
MHRPTLTRLALVVGTLLLLIGLVPTTASAAPPTASIANTTDRGPRVEGR